MLQKEKDLESRLGMSDERKVMSYTRMTRCEEAWALKQRFATIQSPQSGRGHLAHGTKGRAPKGRRPVQSPPRGPHSPTSVIGGHG